MTPDQRAESPGDKPRAELLALAERCGAALTGKPDGSEAITVVFTIQAWRDFDSALLRELANEHMRCPEDGGECGAGGYCRPEPQVEPVAWVTPAELQKLRQFKYYEHDAPLYTHPPQRKPLSERQIVQALAEAGCCGKVVLTYDSGPYEVTKATQTAIDLVRAIERGIGEAP